jgi:hypothetical protein
MCGFVAFCIIAILLFVWDAGLALWIAAAFVFVPFLGGVIFGGRGGNGADDPLPLNERPPYDGPYTQRDRRIDPATGRPWWDK